MIPQACQDETVSRRLTAWLAVAFERGHKKEAMRSSPKCRRITFDALARTPDDAIDLALGAALIAKDIYQDLDIDALVGRLDELAGPLNGGALAGLPLRKQADEVSARFRELGFRGNVDNYYDAKNSLLPDVLERRTGIPITLTLVWCEIARRAGVLARGVGFPGHFLARVDESPDSNDESPSSNDESPDSNDESPSSNDRPIIVDAFAGGRIIDNDGARALLERTLGAGAELHPALFEAASSRTTLVRMLTNLKAVWAGRGEHTKAFVALDRIITLTPDSPRMLRERASVALRLGIVELAHSDFARVLELQPNAPDAPILRKRLAELQTSPRSAPN